MLKSISSGGEMTSQGHKDSLLMALWCYNSGCTQWKHGEGCAAAIKTWKVAYSAVHLAIYRWYSQKALSLSLNEPIQGYDYKGSIGEIYRVGETTNRNCKGKKLREILG